MSHLPCFGTSVWELSLFHFHSELGKVPTQFGLFNSNFYQVERTVEYSMAKESGGWWCGNPTSCTLAAHRFNDLRKIHIIRKTNTGIRYAPVYRPAGHHSWKYVNYTEHIWIFKRFLFGHQHMTRKTEPLGRLSCVWRTKLYPSLELWWNPPCWL